MYTYYRYVYYVFITSSILYCHHYVINILSLLCHHYITGVNDNMTAVIAELNQLLEEAEQVSLERQREMEARAHNQPVVMEIEAAEPATTVRGHVISECC